jgi:hypothetical protein
MLDKAFQPGARFDGHDRVVAVHRWRALLCAACREKHLDAQDAGPLVANAGASRV